MKGKFHITYTYTRDTPSLAVITGTLGEKLSNLPKTQAASQSDVLKSSDITFLWHSDVTAEACLSHYSFCATMVPPSPGSRPAFPSTATATRLMVGTCWLG